MRRFLRLLSIAAVAAAAILPARAARIVSYSVAQCWGGSTTGLLADGTYTTLAGNIPLAAWTQPVTGAANTSAHGDSKGSTVTISKYWDGSAAQTFSGVSGFTAASRITGGSNLYGPSFSDFRSAVNQALNCNGADNVLTFLGIPFAQYDVIVYFGGASESGKRTELTLRPVQVNGGDYVYPRSATPGDNAVAASKTATWGDCSASAIAYGTNAMRINHLTGKTLTLGQYCQNYGIAAVQIIENTDPCRWGNLTTVAGEGVAFSSVDQQGMAQSYGISFADSSNLGYAEIGAAGTLCVTELKFALAQNTPTAPTGVTISDGTTTISSTGVSTATGVKIYGSATQSYTRNITTFTFGSTEELDTSKGLTLTITGAWRGTVVKPTNATTTDGTWSPVFQLVGVYTPVYPRSIAVNFHSNQGTAVAGSGYVPAATWNNVSAANATNMALNDSDGAASGAKLTSSGNTYQWTTAADPILKGYIDDNAAISISVRDIPFAAYDVIVYQATDTANYGFNPPAINGTYYSYDGTRTSATPNDTALKYGQSQQMSPAYGQNVVYVRGKFSGDLTIVGAGNANSARGCIAAIQIVETKSAPIYRATVQNAVKWSEIEWTPSKPAAGFEDGAQLEITTLGSPLVTFDEFVSLSASLSIDGECTFAAGDGLYEDGCWRKTIASFSAFAISGMLSFGDVRSDFVGEYSRTDNGFALRAQNKEVISLNFANGQSVTGTEYAGLAPVQGDTWVNMTDTWGTGSAVADKTRVLPTIKATSDGIVALERETIGGTCYANNTYGWNTATDVLLKGYLDDGGNRAQVTITNIPYSSYDVIVYRATDEASRAFTAVTVNDETYTYDSAHPDTAKVGTATWGSSRGLFAEYGRNAIRVRGQTRSVLTINGNGGVTGARGGIAAIQIVCTGDFSEEHHFTATIGTSKRFSEIVWNEGPFVAGAMTTATITNDNSAADEVVITLDNPLVSLGKLKIVSSRNVRLAASAHPANIAAVDVSECTGKVTYAYPVAALATGNANIAYAGGTSTRVGIVHGAAGTVLNLEGGTYELSETHGDNETTVNVTDSILNYSDAIGVGKGAYVVGGASDVNVVKFVLVQGAGNNCTFTLKDMAEVRVSGTTVDDSNQNSVLFGHWNGNSTFTIRDSAAFRAEGTQILVGETGGNQTINIDGGTVMARGIKASSDASGLNVLNLNGGTLALGDIGIVAGNASRVLKVNVGGNAAIVSGAAMPITQPVTIAEGQTLTFDASAGDIVISGAFANNGTVKVVGGNVVFMDGLNPGTFVEDGGRVLYGYTVNINDLGRKKIPAGKTADRIRLYNEAGRSVPFATEGDYLVFEWEITDGACWWDYEFEQPGGVAPVNTGAEGSPLRFDGDRPVILRNNEYVTNGLTGEVSIRVPSRPWRDVGTWPAAATFMTYGTMVGTDKAYQLAFGSKNGGGSQLFLATRSVADGTVDLCYSVQGAEPTILCTMTVPNAQQARHLYAFVLKTVGGNSVVNTYLDGELLQPYTHTGVLTLGSGFQIASGHGGTATGYNRPADDDPAVLDWLRVYDSELSNEVMAEYARRYPYVSPSGSYQRNVSGSENWDAADAWTKEGAVPAVTTNVPAANSTVKIHALDAATVSVNLSEDVQYEAIAFSGGSAITVSRGSGTGKVRSSGRVTADTDVTFAYDAFEMTGAPLTVKDGKTVTFDLTSIDFNTVWANTTYDLSGLVSTGVNARVQCVYGTVPAGRTVTHGIDPKDSHYKVVVTVAGELATSVDSALGFSSLVWRLGDVVVTPNWIYVSRAKVNVLNDAAEIIFDKAVRATDVTFVFAGGHALSLSKRAADVAVSGVTYDFTGLGAKATFAFDPDVSKVRAGYVRYDLDMGVRMHDAVLPSVGGRYEFKKIRIDGNGYDYHDRTVVVQDGDYLNLHDGTTLACGLSLDVRGGEVDMGTLAGAAAISYGRNGTRFNQSGGTVTVHATGKGQTGTGNGFILAHTPTGGGCHEFNVSGGLFTVPESSINFNERTNTINVTGSGIVRAKGVFSCKATSTGVVNARDGGRVEIGALGWKAGSATFNMSEGVLCGYEAGAFVSNVVTLVGDATFTSESGVTLAANGCVQGGGGLTVGTAGKIGAVSLGGDNTYEGGTTVAVGTLKLAHVNGFGSGAVAVMNNATLDLCGICPTNPIALVGSGVGGAGALVNSGEALDGTNALNLVLADDATLGGSARIWGGSGSCLNLAGHKLTVSGDSGFAFVLATNAVDNVHGGTLVLAGGSFATSGNVSLGTADIEIQSGGSLDLSTGSRISCRNFRSTGRVVGTVATNVVRGILHATSATELTNLELADGATLSGTGLEVSSFLRLGTVLYVEVPEGQTRIATVPETTDVGATTVFYNGRNGYVLRRAGKDLRVVAEHTVTANIAIGSTVAGVNFESLIVSGKVSDFEGKVTGATGATNIYVRAEAEDGSVITRKFEYTGSDDGKFEYTLDDVDLGASYRISAYVEIEGAEVEAYSQRVDAVVARSVNWVDENAKTFAGVKVGTGLWHGTNGVTRVTDGFIRFTSSDWSSSTMFEPTNEVLSVRSSHIRDLHYWAIFNSPGFYTYEDFPLLPQDYLAAVTVVADEDDNCSFAIGLSGAWQLVSRDVFAPELGVEYEILIRVDYATYCISYDVVSEGGNIHLGEYDFTPEVEQLMLEFAGPGAVAQITGICQDAHLMQVGDEEYWDFESARDAAGSTNNIIPLWRSRYYVKDGDGLFRLLDPKGLLELIFAKWYHCFITPDGDVRIYRYIAGNNWIEYADVSGVVRTADGWLVTNEVGLAWIAESATNKWFCGNVMLGANLDLASKNWTPVAQFTGTFDGNGHAIAGLNNTNVIAELGEIGRYPFGPTNDWGRTAYGLFATATNATFRNVAFGDVAIDNFSESVAALLGMHLGGDLTVSNVVVSSGNVQGEGGAVAGILGTSEGWNSLTVAGNTNAAVIEAFAEGAEPRWAAGILTVGGTNETVGPLVVAGNANLATVGNTIYNSEDGGNVAQIIAGTTWGTKFGDVDVLDNEGLGGFDVAWVNHDACRFDLPICNLAAAVVQTAADGRYRRFVEAHDPGAVSVDPVHRTARMLGSKFANDADNIAGWWTDAVTATPDGGHIDISGAGNLVNIWEPVFIDRNLTFNMNSNFVYTVYDNDTFVLSAGVTATVSNGVVYVGEGCEAFGGDTAGLKTNDVKVVKLDEDFYERTVMLVDGYFLSVSEAMDYLHAGACIELFEGTGLTIDAASNAVLLDGMKIAELPAYQSLVDASAGGAVAYMVRLNEKAVPNYDFEMTGVSGARDEVKINIVGARAGFYYAVQHKTSLVEAWSEPERKDWVRVDSDGSMIQFTLPATEASGFYRIKVTDYLSDDE